MPSERKNNLLGTRFRNLLPVVIDLETSGINPATDGLLEIALVTLTTDSLGKFRRDQSYAYHIDPFVNAHLNAEALAVNRIDPYSPLRFSMTEQQMLHTIFSKINPLLARANCPRAVLVGHNAWFDLMFIQAAAKRCHLPLNPFHSFTTLDTASLSALVFGETVLAKACKSAGISFNVNEAHSAIYDAERTAELFCFIVNNFERNGVRPNLLNCSK